MRPRHSDADLLAMIPLYLDGELDEAEQAAVEAYLAEHPEAARELAEAARLIDTLDEAVAPPTLDPAFTAEVLSRCRELSRLQRGDCVGEMAVLDLMPRSAAARADRRCVALEITRRCLAELYQRDPEQYAIIMMNMGREVSRRLRKADDRLFELEQAVAY